MVLCKKKKIIKGLEQKPNKKKKTKKKTACSGHKI